MQHPDAVRIVKAMPESGAQPSEKTVSKIIGDTWLSFYACAARHPLWVTAPPLQSVFSTLHHTANTALSENLFMLHNEIAFGNNFCNAIVG